MAFIRLPDGVRVALEYEAFGKIVVNVYHVTTTDPIITVKLVDIAEIFETWWAVDMASNFSDEIELTNITALNLDEANGEKIILPITPAVPGGMASTAVPNNVALVVSMNTAQTGRSFRGRAYSAGLSSADVDGNDITSVKAAAIITDYEQLDTDLTAENVQLVVASFVSNKAPRAEAIGTNVVSFSANTRVDTQRRRLPA